MFTFIFVFVFILIFIFVFIFDYYLIVCVMLCCVVLCYVMLCYVVSRYDILLCFVVLCHFMLYYVIYVMYFKHTLKKGNMHSCCMYFRFLEVVEVGGVSSDPKRPSVFCCQASCRHVCCRRREIPSALNLSASKPAKPSSLQTADYKTP